MEHTHPSAHIHTATVDKELIHRMNYLIGHLQGVRKMIENDAYCIDIVTQNLGVIAALKKVNEKLLTTHMNHCLVDAIKSEDMAEREAKLQELQEIIHKVS